MKNKKLFESIIIGLGVVISGAFCINSSLKLADNMSHASAVSSSEDVHSVKNITVDNITDKNIEIENIDIGNLNYNDELSDFYQKDTYVDADDSIYVYDEEDNLISYTINNGENVDKSSKITEKKAIELSKEYLSHLIEKSSDYVLQDVNYDTYQNIYNVVYGHQVCGLRTSDIVYITINGKEELIGYSIPNVGRFDEVFLDEKQIKNAKEQGIAKICEQYNNIKSVGLETTVILILNDNDEIVANVTVEGTVCANNGKQDINDSVEIPLQSL